LRECRCRATKGGDHPILPLMKQGGAWLVFSLAFFLTAGLLPLRATMASDTPGPAGAFYTLVDPDIKKGYILREDTWNGDLPIGETKAIAHQLTKGNEYRFYLRTDVKAAKLSVHVYDQDGNLAEADSWHNEANDGSSAGASVKPGRTGTYFLIVKVEKSPEERTVWGMAYAYK
jgi:hypothetical protein